LITKQQSQLGLKKKTFIQIRKGEKKLCKGLTGPLLSERLEVYE